MKLFLTSAGITNQSLANALISLVGKPIGEITIGFIPTAANVEPGNKDWYIAQLTNLHKYGLTWIDVVDISASEVAWNERLADIDVILVGGGNTFHLLDQIRKTKFDDWLSVNLGNKVYVGISAGAIIATPCIAIAGVDDGDVNNSGITDVTGLHFVDFEISVHTPESVSHEGNKKYRETISNELYALDNESGIVVENEKVDVVSEGTWCLY